MQKLKVYSSFEYDREKKYIIDVIFNYWFGIETELVFEQGLKSFKIVVENEKSQSVNLPDILFQTPREKWLKKESHPMLPLASLELNNNYKYLNSQVPILYGTSQDLFSCRIDILGSIFFLITRYEEIDYEKLDEFERYNFVESVAYKGNFLQRPLANEYLEILWNLLSQTFPDLQRKKRNYHTELSHDVDWPLSVNCSFIKFIQNVGADLIYRKSPATAVKRIIGKIQSIFDRKYKLDPNNNFDYIMSLSQKYGLKSCFNFLTIDGGGGIDGNYNIQDPFFVNLLKKINSNGHEIGFHASYFTLNNEQKTELEFEKLLSTCKSLNIDQKDFGGRQHYLRWQNPITWEAWEKAGAAYDSSLCYEKALGFRAGTCYEYPVFNLIERKSLKLIEKPLIIMDVTLFQLLKTEAQMLEVISSFSEICRHFNGNFNFLIHNNYIITPAQKRFYEKILKIVA